MRWSEYFLPTLKEEPQEAEAKSHKLMVRAGLIRRLTSGAYTYLPLGLRVLRKVERIIREEMDAKGAQELLMPALHPAEIWKRTGRYDQMGEVLISFVNRHGREMVLGPTHEEIITELVSGELRSYKELPYTLYQIQSKFRDEPRARFGVVRSCEFIMKDAYSFDTDTAGLERSYAAMYEAYCNIFSRCGLDYVPVKADPGLMGGDVSHEFMVPAEIGEDLIATCKACSWAASGEVAECVYGSTTSAAEEKEKKVQERATPGKSSVQDVAVFLGCEAEKLIKTLIYLADGEPVAVLVRGDHEANETKIKRRLGVQDLLLADGAVIQSVTGGTAGFSGPVGLAGGVKIYADLSLKDIRNAVTGANREGFHLINVNHSRDFEVDEWFDARCVTEKDPCPGCGGVLEITAALEVGHTFKLGTKYSSVLGAKYLDEGGKEFPAVMGCYGIGVNRIIAAVLENAHDPDGIVWPVGIAPFEVVILPLKMGEEPVAEAAEELYASLMEMGVDVMLDDRVKSAGVKFKDADLVGFPVQVIVGQKALARGGLEVKVRRSGEVRLARIKDAAETVRDILSGIRGESP